MPVPSPATDSDPLSAWAPEPDATPQLKAERLAREAAEKRTSDAIDASLREERAAMSKRSFVKLMLLGQSESGKSTVLKNLQMNYAPAAWARARAASRTVIQLNLLRSIIIILDVLSEASSPPPGVTLSRQSSQSSHDHHAGAATLSRRAEPPSSRLTEKHTLLRLRLAPLRSVARDLQRVLTADAGDPASDAGEYPVGYEDAFDEEDEHHHRGIREFFVRAHAHDAERALARREQILSDSMEVISGCRDDMQSLWHDPVVHEILADRGLRLWQQAGFFLDDIDRIARIDYDPTDADAVRARLKTLGVQEHQLAFERVGVSGEDSRNTGRPLGGSAALEWRIFDVGGERTIRHAWVPYFDDVTAIIFLAPVSCFDEQLAENPKINRLQDSVELYTAIVSSPLLVRATVILFLNKCDLLDRKLQSGVKISAFLSSYGTRANDRITFVQYLLGRFQGMLTKKAPKGTSPRKFYGYPTSAIDTAATRLTLQTVHEIVIRRHLQDAGLL